MADLEGGHGDPFELYEKGLFSELEEELLGRAGPPDDEDPAEAPVPAADPLEGEVPPQEAVLPPPETGLAGPADYDFFLSVDRTGRHSSRRRRRKPMTLRIAITAAAVLTVGLATTLGLTLSRRGPFVPGAGMTPTAFITSATEATLARHTADLVISGSIREAGATFPIQGTGEVDLTTRSCSLLLNASAQGEALVERELLVGGSDYLGLTLNGNDAVSAAAPGKEWVRIPLHSKHTPTLGVGTFNPVSQLQLLAKQGFAVRPLGSATVDGVKTSGFAVTFGPKAINQLKAAEPGFEATSLSLKFDVWIDSAGLVRSETMSLKVQTANPASPVSVHATVTFENFGTPVSISAPAEGSVIGLTKFLADEAAVPNT